MAAGFNEEAAARLATLSGARRPASRACFLARSRGDRPARGARPDEPRLAPFERTRAARCSALATSC